MDKEIDRGCKSGIVQQGSSRWRPSDTGKIGGISYNSPAVYDVSGILVSNGTTGFYDPSGVVNFPVHVRHPDLSN